MLFFDKNIVSFDILSINIYKKLILNDNKNLCSIIEKYNNIENRNLLEKSNLLNEIILNIKNVKLKKLIKSRLNYINSLLYLYNNGILLKNDRNIFNKELIVNFLNNFKNKNLTQLQDGVFINNENHCFGNYFLEIIDPCHRILNSYKLEYDKLNTDEDFFIFMERYKNNNDNRIIFFDNNDFKKYLVYIKYGKFYFMVNNEFVPINTNNHKYLFTINKDYKIYCYRESNVFHHVSSTRGQPVFGAGNIVVEDGMLKELNLDTGHYLIKSDKVLLVLNIFNKLGINYEKSIKIEFFKNDNSRHKKTLEDFLKSNTI